MLLTRAMAESFTDTPMLTARFDAALHFATRHHARQLRKGTPVPYAAHLLAVASLVLEMHGSEDEAIGGAGLRARARAHGRVRRARGRRAAPDRRRDHRARRDPSGS